MQTLGEYAKAQGVSVDTIRRRVKSGKLPSRKVSGKWYIMDSAAGEALPDSSPGITVNPNQSPDDMNTQQLALYQERLKIKKDELEIDLKRMKLDSTRAELLGELRAELVEEFKGVFNELRKGLADLCEPDKLKISQILSDLKGRL